MDTEISVCVLRRCFAAMMSAGLFFCSTAAHSQFGAPRINDCNEYIAKTMAQIEMTCFKEGKGQPVPQGRWHPFKNPHLDWCKTATPEQRGNEVWAREIEQGRPDTCRGFRQYATVFFGSAFGSCQVYAWRAYIQTRLAAALGQFVPACRFSGARWDPNLESHRGYCSSNPGNKVLEAEDRARRQAIFACAPPGTRLNLPRPNPVR